jgi:hypothetical protein
LAIVALMTGVLGLSACSDVRDVFGNRKDPPDEFQVVARAPLALPPNFDLRPPRPGADRPQEGSTTDMAARRILGRGAARTTQGLTGASGSMSGTSSTGGTSSAAAGGFSGGFGFGGFGAPLGSAPAAAPTPSVGVTTRGADQLRGQLGVDEAQPDIRQVVNEETEEFAYDTRYPIDRLLFWKPKPPKGIVVDPNQENRRLKQNSALGKSVTDGQTPTIERKRGGILEGIF